MQRTPSGLSPGLTAGVWRVAAGPRQVHFSTYVPEVCIASDRSTRSDKHATFSHLLQLKPRQTLQARIERRNTVS